MNLTVKLTPAQLTELKEDIARECQFEHNVAAQDDIDIDGDRNSRGRCNLTIPVRGGVTMEGLLALAKAYEPTIGPEVGTVNGRTWVRLYSIPQCNLPITFNVI